MGQVVSWVTGAMMAKRMFSKQSVPKPSVTAQDILPGTASQEPTGAVLGSAKDFTGAKKITGKDALKITPSKSSAKSRSASDDEDDKFYF